MYIINEKLKCQFTNREVYSLDYTAYGTGMQQLNLQLEERQICVISTICVDNKGAWNVAGCGSG